MEMLKKMLALVMAVALLVAVAPIRAYADETVVVFQSGSSDFVVDGERRTTDVKVYIDEHSRLMVPLSHLSFAFGVSPVRNVGWMWDDLSKTATIIDEGKIIEVTSGSRYLMINGSPLEMDTTAVIVDDRMFLPVRFVGEALGFSFVWRDSDKTATAVKYTEKPKAPAPLANPGSGTAAVGSKVELIGGYNTTIYYTTDGSNPTSASSYYTNPVTLNRSGQFVIKAIASAEGYRNSDVATYVYNVGVDSPSVTPILTPILTPTITLTPTPTPTPAEAETFSLLRDSFKFGNSPASFGYPANYRIPLSVFEEFMTPAKAKYNYQRAGIWGGSCYGFSAASLLFYRGEYQPESYQSSASEVYDLQAPRSANASLTKLIEKYQVSQFLDSLDYLEDQNRGKMGSLISAVQDSEKPGGDLVVVCVYQDGYGHAVVGYHVNQTSSGYEISIYDNNFPGSERILKINSAKNSYEYTIGGQFGTWRTADGAGISFLPVSAILAETKYQTMNNVLLTTSDVDGSIENGSSQRIEDIPGAIEVHNYTDTKQTGRSFILPADKYTVEPSSTMNVAIATDDAYVTVDGLDSNSKLSSDLTSSKLIDVVTEGESTFSVSCLSKDTGYQEIELEVTSSGNFAAEVSGGKLQLSGNAEVKVNSGADAVDKSKLGPMFTVFATFPSKGLNATVSLVGLKSVSVGSDATSAVLSDVPEGVYQIEVRYANDEFIEQEVQVNKVNATEDLVVNVFMS
jgi:hypothetical protein